MPNLDEIKARRGSITQGVWEHQKNSMHSLPGAVNIGTKHIALCNYCEFPDDTVRVPLEETHANADFIANAPSDIDWLVGEVERLREEKKRLIADFAKSDQFIVVQLGYALGWHKDVDLELARKEIGVETMDDYLFCVAGDHTAETMAMAVRDKMEEHRND